MARSKKRRLLTIGDNDEKDVPNALTCARAMEILCLTLGEAWSNHASALTDFTKYCSEKGLALENSANPSHSATLVLCYLATCNARLWQLRCSPDRTHPPSEELELLESQELDIPALKRLSTALELGFEEAQAAAREHGAVNRLVDYALYLQAYKGLRCKLSQNAKRHVPGRLINAGMEEKANPMRDKWEEMMAKRAEQKAREDREIIEMIRILYNRIVAADAVFAAVAAGQHGPALTQAMWQAAAAAGQHGPALPQAMWQAAAAAGQHGPAPPQAMWSIPAESQANPGPAHPQCMHGSTPHPSPMPYTAESLRQPAPPSQTLLLWEHGLGGSPALKTLEQDPSWRRGKREVGRKVCDVKMLVLLIEWYLVTHCSNMSSRSEAIAYLDRQAGTLKARNSQWRWLTALQNAHQKTVDEGVMSLAGQAMADSGVVVHQEEGRDTE